MIQFVASLRRAFVALAAISLLSALTPAFSRAQSDAKPADPATPAATDAMAPAGPQATKAKKAKKAKPPKPAKMKQTAVAKPVAVAKPKVEKPAKAAKAKEPELSFEEQKKADGVYMKGSNWMSARFGWAKRAGEFNGDGLVGYGVGYSHMVSPRLAFAVHANHDIVGHFGSHLDEMVSFSGEFQRHFRWKAGVRPYIGLGGGYYVKKYYRTGDDRSSPTGGPHVSLGFTSAIDERHLIGLEFRGARLDGRPGISNPTFGTGGESEIVWTVKGSWAIAY